MIPSLKALLTPPKITRGDVFKACIFLSPLLFLCAFQAGGADLQNLLTLTLVDVKRGEWWRIYTGNYVHFTWYHTVMNGVGVAFLAILFWTEKVRYWLLSMLFIPVCVGLLQYFFSQDLAEYRGFSGAFHGLMAFGLLLGIRFYGLILLLPFAGLVGKVLYEQRPEYDVLYLIEQIDVPVATDAHFFGLISGIVPGIVIALYRYSRSHMPKKKHPKQDRNFDGLTRRFKNNIYNTPKGQLRLAVLRRDFAEFLPRRSLSILDVGCGQGQWALELALQGHKLYLNDVSAEMIGEAQKVFLQSTLNQSEQQQVRWSLGALQGLRQEINERFDVLMCHAVMEWLNEPACVFEHLLPLVKPGGYLSLVFYNVHGLIYKNLLRANYRKIEQQDYHGTDGSLTPLNPLSPATVRHWIREAGLDIVCESGLRVFHDYVLDPEMRRQNLNAVTRLELQLSREEPYRSMGRYVHMLCRKPPT